MLSRKTKTKMWTAVWDCVTVTEGGKREANEVGIWEGTDKWRRSAARRCRRRGNLGKEWGGWWLCKLVLLQSCRADITREWKRVCVCVCSSHTFSCNCVYFCVTLSFALVSVSFLKLLWHLLPTFTSYLCFAFILIFCRMSHFIVILLVFWCHFLLSPYSQILLFAFCRT